MINYINYIIWAYVIYIHVIVLLFIFPQVHSTITHSDSETWCWFITILFLFGWHVNLMQNPKSGGLSDFFILVFFPQPLESQLIAVRQQLRHTVLQPTKSKQIHACNIPKIIQSRFISLIPDLVLVAVAALHQEYLSIF